jgi:hypothetical protein
MEKSIFLAKGRINRITYLLRLLIAYAIYKLATLQFSTLDHTDNLNYAFLAIYIFYLYFLTVQGVKRAHDVGV